MGLTFITVAVEKIQQIILQTRWTWCPKERNEETLRVIIIIIFKTCFIFAFLLMLITSHMIMFY